MLDLANSFHFVIKLFVYNFAYYYLLLGSSNYFKNDWEFVEI